MRKENINPMINKLDELQNTSTNLATFLRNVLIAEEILNTLDAENYQTIITKYENFKTELGTIWNQLIVIDDSTSIIE